MNHVYQLNSRWCCHQVFSLTTNIVAFEQRFNDAGTRRRATYAILLKCCPQLLIVYKLSRCFHGAQQRSLRIVFRRCGPFLRERGRVRPLLSLCKVL